MARRGRGRRCQVARLLGPELEPQWLVIQPEWLVLESQRLVLVAPAVEHGFQRRQRQWQQRQWQQRQWQQRAQQPQWLEPEPGLLLQRELRIEQPSSQQLALVRAE